jgi:hypothetical protein
MARMVFAAFVAAVVALAVGGVANAAPRSLFVANFNSPGSNGGSIESFALGATGNVAPLTYIGGDASGLTNPSTVAVDAAGEAFTIAGTFSGSPAIAVYAAGATGNVPPARVITDANPSHFIFNVAADAAGYAYALYETTDGKQNGIDVFAPGASGVSTPVRTISGKRALLDPISTIVEIAVDANGDLWWFCDGEVNTERLVEYAPGASGNAKPVRDIEGSLAFPQVVLGFAVDERGTVFAGGGISIARCRTCRTGKGESVEVFAPGQSGNVRPAREMRADCLPNCTPVAIASNRLFFVAEIGLTTPAILAYDTRGRGVLHPVQTIEGAATGLDDPLFAAVH